MYLGGFLGIRFKRLAWGFLFVALQNFTAQGANENDAEPAPSPKYSLADLLKRAEENQLLSREIEAFKKTAQLKIQEVERARWLTSFESRLVGGVVPDASLDDPNNINSFQAYDLENDFSFNRLGGFVNIKVEAVQPLYTFGKISNLQDAARKAPILAEWEEKKKRAEARFMVKRAYYTRLLSGESVTILDEVHRKLKEAADKVEELLIKDSDNVSETDRLKIKVFQADVQNRLLDAERGLKVSTSVLSELCGISSDWMPADPRLEVEQIEGLRREDVISAALRGRPDLQQIQTVIEIKQNEVNVARSQLFPTIFAAGQVEFAYAPGREDIKNPYLVDDFNKYNLGVVLGMKQDLGIWRSWNKMDQLRAEVDRLRAQRDQLSVKVRLDSEKAYEEAFSAFQGIRVNEDGFRAARSWLTSTGLAFNLGTAETKDVLESFAAYFKARADLLKSIYSVNIALSELSSTAGIEVVERLK
jgi:multidrug efflux system outer membrane protein